MGRRSSSQDCVAPGNQGASCSPQPRPLGLPRNPLECGNFDADLARLLAIGYSIGHAGSVRGRGRFVYLLTEGHPGTIVELFDMSQGRDRVFAEIAAAAHHWDGRNPIRTTLPTG